MRSPWKFIADLTYRQKAKEVDGVGGDGDAISDPSAIDVARSVIDDRQIERATDNAELGADLSDGNFTLSSPENEQLQISPMDHVVPGEPHNHQVEETDGIASDQTNAFDPASAAAPRAKEPSRTPKPTKLIAAKSAGGSAVTPPAINQLSALENARLLEQEIASLRSQLSGKLVAQNQQLRSLLKRYDSK